jgi:hypothetical protein
MLNGKKEPDTLNVKKGISYRLRLINISFGWADIETSITHNGSPVNWKPLAKDGADFPSWQQIIKPAVKQSVSIGQTLDFEFTPPEPGDYLLQVGSTYAFFTPINMVMHVKE